MAERVTVDDDVVGSKPIRHPEEPPLIGRLLLCIEGAASHHLVGHLNFVTLMPGMVRVYARFRAGIERRDGGNLVLGERKIENVDVLGDPAWIGGPWDGNEIIRPFNDQKPA